MIHFDVTEQDGVQVIQIAGSLDATTSNDANKQLEAAIENNSRIVLDMASLDYLSSAGVRVLLGAIKATRSNNGDLRLANMSGMVLDTLQLAGITSITKSYDDVNSAVASFAS